MDHEDTVDEPTRRFGLVQRSTPEVEDFFWRVVLNFEAVDDVAKVILERLHPPDDVTRGQPAELLDLGRENRIRLRARLRVAGAEVLRTVVRDSDALERVIRHPSRLPEAAFALRGRPREAAALYALEHDRLRSRLAEEDPSYRQIRLAALRYEVARALHQVEGKNTVAHEVMESVIRLMDDTLEPPERDRSSEGLQLGGRLSFHAREWLGFRYVDEGRYAEAQREFLRAADAAPEPNLAVAAHMFAANAMVRDGRYDEAQRLLYSLRVDEERLTSPIADEWAEFREHLIAEGGHATHSEEGGESPQEPEQLEKPSPDIKYPGQSAKHTHGIQDLRLDRIMADRGDDWNQLRDKLLAGELPI